MNMIEVADYDGRHRKVLFTLDKDSEPRGIVADPYTGWV